MNTLSKIPFLIFTEIFYEFSPKFPKIPPKLKKPKLKKTKFFAPKFFAINVEGFSTPIRADRNSEGAGILIYFREDIPYSILKVQLPENIEAIFTEFKLRNKKWLLLGCYNPKKEYISYFLDHIGRNLDNLIGNHENLLIIGDLNSQMIEDEMNEFCDT